ncbi:MAG: ABC transporter ATP-binding protein [Clostridia bacterium]|nr:ABC transporter ATP-binding protein [Clostridia bacterium]
MENRTTLTARVCSLEPSLKPEDVLLPVDFNLAPSHLRTRVDGLTVLLRDRMIVWINGEKKQEIPLTDVKEILFRRGIGCTFIEYCDKSGLWHTLCRADMQYQDFYAAASREMSRHLEGKEISYEYEKEINHRCPKCNRQYRPGSNICEHCVDKKNYILRLWALTKGYRHLIYLSIVFYFIIAAANLIPPYINRILVDDYIKADEMPELGAYIVVILSMFVMNIITRLLSMVRSVLLIRAGNKTIVTLREMVFDKIQMMSIARISKRTSGELMNRVSNDTGELSRFITHELGNMLEQILILLAVGFYLFAYDWRLALMIILPTPLVMYSNRLFRRFMRQMFHRQWQMGSRANSILHDTFSGIRVVKAFGMEKREIARYDEITQEERDTQIRNELFWGKVQPWLNFLMGVGEYFLLYYVGNKIIGGTMTIGEMTQFSAYVSIIYGPLRWLSFLPRRLTRLMTSIVKIFDVIDEAVDVADKDDAIDHDIDGTITFDNVSFGYDKTAYVLKNISCEIKPGEMIGIVGKSGVGKSTLINLVMRMYDVSDGAIKIDGIDIKDISQQSLRSQIGVVLQETFLFSGTIYDNIAYAKPDATRDEVITAAKIAGAHSFIMKLPNAYNTKVGERGHTLSGGERQRVAIARALLHNPRILILDEATASLDTETEKQIQDALQKLIADRTTLAIAHRLSTLRNATKILVLDKGGLAEMGTHEELIAKKGIYYGLVMAQRQMSKMSPKNQETPAPAKANA